jgi:hypothetical protein
LENELKIVKAISIDRYELWIRNGCKNLFKKGTVQSKTYIYMKDIKELNLTKACEYLGTEESHDLQHKHEKEELK